MMYQIRNDEEEHEPRITPKPSSRIDSLTLPSVPEVSLIFDKPLSGKTEENLGFHSPIVQSNGLTHKSNISSPLHINGSYAAWKEKNYAYKPSKIHEHTSPQQVKPNHNYVVQSHLLEDNVLDPLNESKTRRHIIRKSVHNSLQHKEKLHAKNDDCTTNYSESSDISSYAIKEKRQDIMAQSNKAMGYHDSISQSVKQCTSPDNYAVKESEYYPLEHERKLTTHNSGQPNETVMEQNVQSLPVNLNSLPRSELHFPHYLAQQYPYFNMNTYPFPQIHPYPIHNTETQETVKNLLQIINSQNEQIKSLQTQVDRLLKMQEENLKEQRCSCSFKAEQQYDQLLINSNNNKQQQSTLNHATTANSNQRSYQSESPRENRKDYKENENEILNQRESIYSDLQSKQKFMEQKVSIGVMTSFEFTVQNSPFNVDAGDYEKKDSQRKHENVKLCNTNNGRGETNESIRRYKNSFTRMPSAQLENIVEDSESYMSSSHQHSSNLNASTSIKDLDKQAYAEIQKEIDIHRSESPRFSKSVTMKLNETKDCLAHHLERTPPADSRNCEIVRAPETQINTMKTEYNVTKNRNYKVNTPDVLNEYNKQNMQERYNFVKESKSESSSDYYGSYQKREQQSATKKTNCTEGSLILNGGDLEIKERPPPTPEPSIHVEMQEYSSDDDSEKVKRSSKVGWTFYNNVLGQVNQLLQNSCVVDDQQQNQGKVDTNECDEIENKAVLDTVKVATLEQLKKLGISLSENPETKDSSSSNKMGFDLSFYPRLDYQANMTQTTNTVNETNTSMHMKALALKYLTDEQLAELAVQRQGSTSVKHLMVSNVQGTNMSLATMRYLERYQLLPGKNNTQPEGIGRVQDGIPPNVDLKFANPRNSPKTLQRFAFSQTPRTTCPSKILDISTLKQQPKLL